MKIQKKNSNLKWWLQRNVNPANIKSNYRTKKATAIKAVKIVKRLKHN